MSADLAMHGAWSEASNRAHRRRHWSTGAAWSIAQIIVLTYVALAGHRSAFAQDHGTVVAWGRDEHGHTSVPEGLSGVIAISAGFYHNLALKRDGTVVAWGDDEFGQATVPAGLSDVVAIAAGEYHSLALKSDGRVVAWGRNYEGQATVPETLSDVVAISAGLHSLALTRDGTVVGWGEDDVGPAVKPPAELTSAVAISAGGDFGLALTEDGSFVGWGANQQGQLAVPAGLSDVVAFDSGWNHSLALRRNGTVVAWGENLQGQATVPQGLTDVVAVVADRNQSMAIRSDGSVVTWGSYYEGDPVSAPPGLSNVIAGAGGGYHTLALIRSSDTTPPTLTLPHALIVLAQSAEGALVSFAASAIDDVDSTTSVTCSPASGAMFAPGLTRVTCTATDRARNTSSRSFKVLVVPECWWWLTDVVRSIEGVRADGAGADGHR